MCSIRATPQGCIIEQSTGLADATSVGCLEGLVRIRLREASGFVLGVSTLLRVSLAWLSVAAIKTLTESRN